MSLAELQQRFLAGLERRLSDATALIEGGADPNRLMRIFHSLAGIAGTYGFHSMTDTSRECEELCAFVFDEHRVFASAECDRLRIGIARIRNLAPPLPQARTG